MVQIPPSPEMIGLRVVQRFIGELAARRTVKVIYRGHGDRSFLPVPHALRPKTIGIVDADGLRQWRTLAARFVGTMGPVELLALAQHFGIPTPLLDWTANPLLALYFASRSGHDDATGAVIAAPTFQFQEFQDYSTVSVFKADTNRIGLIDAGHLNERARAQDSWMTLHPPHRPAPESYFPCFEIAPEEKGPVRFALAMFGLTESRVYSDLNMAASEMKNWLTINDVFRQ